MRIHQATDYPRRGVSSTAQVLTLEVRTQHATSRWFNDGHDASIWLSGFCERFGGTVQMRIELLQDSTSWLRYTVEC
jgi:hypothetical protein